MMFWVNQGIPGHSSSPAKSEGHKWTWIQRQWSGKKNTERDSRRRSKILKVNEPWFTHMEDQVSISWVKLAIVFRVLSHWLKLLERNKLVRISPVLRSAHSGSHLDPPYFQTSGFASINKSWVDFQVTRHFALWKFHSNVQRWSWTTYVDLHHMQGFELWFSLAADRYIGNLHRAQVGLCLLKICHAHPTYRLLVIHLYAKM